MVVVSGVVVVVAGVVVVVVAAAVEFHFKSSQPVSKVAHFGRKDGNGVSSLFSEKYV